AAVVPATSASAAGCTFSIKAHPDSEATPFDQLDGIDALSGTNIWAVGLSNAGDDPLVEHYNGHKWTIVPAPTKGAGPELSDGAAISATNVWAVGNYSPPGAHIRTLVEHWNGKKWTIFPSPNPVAGSDNFLKGVAAVSATNVWAVGANGRPGTKPIIEHW